MLTGGQIAAGTGVVVPNLAASALVIGGFHNRPVAFALFAFAGLWLVGAVLFVPLRNAYWGRTGNMPIRVSHVQVGNGAIVTLNLGTEPDVTDVRCELHIPHSDFVGGVPKATALVAPGQLRDRQILFTFPDSFGLPPIFGQVRCLGSYQVNWVVTQFGQTNVVRDRFRIRKVALMATIRRGWRERHDRSQSFVVWLCAVLSLYVLRVLRLARFQAVERAWTFLFNRTGDPHNAGGKWPR
jgi:hypothetical protein